MGQQGARVDTSALAAVADHFDSAADIVARAARAPLSFDGALAGRAHTVDGDALRRSMDRLTAELAHWSRAAAEIGACLRAGADRYADADQRVAARIG
jgi:uncharacterized protein YukE